MKNKDCRARTAAAGLEGVM